ncbi:50S ribosomal protein L24 [Candidatus Saccharibacteria bacterium]|nr:50S ribosomal protein L24 [Candidatus Saccharibacteria bacterium]
MSDRVFKTRLQKGDTVIVTTGKGKGKTGKIVSVYPKSHSVTVDKVNVVKRHIKPNQKHPQGGIVELTKPIDISNVAYYDQAKKTATKVGIKVTDSKKVRIAKKSGKEIK